MTTKPENVDNKICSKCEETKPLGEFYKRGLICCECNNSKRRQKYKNNKIITEQIENHYKILIKYHIENKLDLPQVFIDLFAKHLADGNPLKLSLPLTLGNISEDHD